MEIWPSACGFQHALSKRRARRVREKKLVLQDLRSLGEFRAGAWIAHQHGSVQFAEVPNASLPSQDVIEHRRDSGAFDNGVASELRIIIRFRCFGPLVDMEMLVMQCMGQLV